MIASRVDASFDRIGPAVPVSPVILSVPHAGRDYPPELIAALRVPAVALLPLEDRHADRLALAALAEETLFVARRPRAWIDLNRSEDERDPALEEHPPRGVSPSARVRGGLGLVPRRCGTTELWRSKLARGEIERRILADHRPYHAALAATLAAARARFGVAVLLDIHSMPAIVQAEPPRLVFGDRFGHTAAARIVAALEGVALAASVRFALNTPYAGGHILDRHGAPATGIHAIQIEFDRALYLDAAQSAPGPGLPAAARLLRAMIDAVAAEALPALPAIAAE